MAQVINKGDASFVHHEVNADGTPGPASVVACQTGIAVLNGARGGTKIPTADRQGVYNHLAAHLRDAGVEPPPLKQTEADGTKSESATGVQEPLESARTTARFDAESLRLRAQIEEMRVDQGKQ